jgi:hypothetical protein
MGSKFSSFHADKYFPRADGEIAPPVRSSGLRSKVRCLTSDIMILLAAGPDGRSSRDGRKVRTPQSSVPDNVREVGFKPGRRKVPQKTYRSGRKAEVRVKRCGKSAPPPQ